MATTLIELTPFNIKGVGMFITLPRVLTYSPRVFYSPHPDILTDTPMHKAQA